MKVCLVCKKEFKPSKRCVNTQKYCSTRCKSKFHYKDYYQKYYKHFEWKKERKCKLCGKEFMPRQVQQLFCSRQCLKKDWKKRHWIYTLEEQRRRFRRKVTERRSKIPPKTCPICRKVFTAIENRNVSFIAMKFCSKKCWQKDYLIRRRTKRRIETKELRENAELRICEYCGKKFKPGDFWNFRTVRFCSRKCNYRSLYKRHSKNEDWRAKYSFYRKNRRHRIKANGGTILRTEWEELKKKYNYKCMLCGRKEPFNDLSYKYLTMDHIIPIFKGGRHEISNVQPLCIICNSKKGVK